MSSLNKRVHEPLLGDSPARSTPGKMYPVASCSARLRHRHRSALLVLRGRGRERAAFYAILSLPVLFAAGMCLFDTLDGCFMNFAYDGRFSSRSGGVLQHHHHRALGRARFVIGTIEIVGSSRRVRPARRILGHHGDFNINRAGFIIVGMFVSLGDRPCYLAVRHIESRLDVSPLWPGPRARLRFEWNEARGRGSL